MQRLGGHRADHTQYTEQYHGQEHRIQRGTVPLVKTVGMLRQETYGEYEYFPSTSSEFMLAQASNIWLTV